MIEKYSLGEKPGMRLLRNSCKAVGDVES